MKFIRIMTNSWNDIRIVRNFFTSFTFSKLTPNKGSNDWLTRQLNDVYVRKSRYDRYRCRSAYKLLEIDEKYNILKPGHSVVDCGAAPGSWTQVAVKKLKLDKDLEEEEKQGIVISVDLQHIMPIKGAIIISESNFTEPSVQQKISELLPGGKADVILSDMAPKASGMSHIDSVEILKLVYSALSFAVLTLKKRGVFLCKVWDSNEVETLYSNLQNLFTTVKRIKPKASRSDSSELFILAKGFKGIK
nr:rRNA methyltransferase 2, mitochondrial-like [Parasteatoda tepidariorum]